MHRDEELRMVVADLVRVMHDQAVGLERLVDHLGQTIGRLPEGADLSVIRSELTAIHLRARKLIAGANEKA